MNERRNAIAHSMATKKLSARDVARMAREYKRLLAKVFSSFNDGDDHFTWFYACYLHDPVIDEFIRKQLLHVPRKERKLWNALRRQLKKKRATSTISALRGRTETYSESRPEQ